MFVKGLVGHLCSPGITCIQPFLVHGHRPSLPGSPTRRSTVSTMRPFEIIASALLLTLSAVVLTDARDLVNPSRMLLSPSKYACKRLHVITVVVMSCILVVGEEVDVVIFLGIRCTSPHPRVWRPGLSRASLHSVSTRMHAHRFKAFRVSGRNGHLLEK